MQNNKLERTKVWPIGIWGQKIFVLFFSEDELISQALGLTTGVFHVEAKYTSRGPRIVEVNCLPEPCEDVDIERKISDRKAKCDPTRIDLHSTYDR